MNDDSRDKVTDAKNATCDEALVSVVDDDDLTRSSTQRLLRSAGLQVGAFASGEEFLKSGVMKKTACLVLDLRMPGMNGLQLQQRLADDANPVPIIFVSAHSSLEEERQAMQAGALQFLQKPVSKDALLHAIRGAIEIPPNNKRKTP